MVVNFSNFDMSFSVTSDETVYSRYLSTQSVRTIIITIPLHSDLFYFPCSVQVNYLFFKNHQILVLFPGTPRKSMRKVDQVFD